MATASSGSGMIAAYIGLGGNLGNVEHTLERALELLDALPGCALERVSGVYRTEPQGFKEQPFFLNRVARLLCPDSMQPEELLEHLLALEAEFGRDRQTVIQDGPRPLDLDLLLFGTVKRQDRRLTLPHPRMHRRAFVLVPLAEIAPDLLLSEGLTVRDALGALNFRVNGREILQD